MSDRKYRQRGYQDEPERDRGRRREPSPRREGPRGRGLGRPTASVLRCARCGRQQELVSGLARDARCAGCGDDLHTCTNCTHFDTSARFECRQEIERRVPAKAKANDCSLFAAKTAREVDGGATESRPDDARAAFDALFDKL